MVGDVECIRINGHKFTGSRAVRNMFSIEYIIPSGNGRETNEVVVLAKDMVEALTLTRDPTFAAKIGKVTEVVSLGTCIDMELVKKFNERPEKPNEKSPLGCITRDRFQGIEAKT